MPLASLRRRFARRIPAPFHQPLHPTTLLIACLALSAQAPAEEPVRLPPFIVKEPLLGPRWRLARTDRFEVLSRSNDHKATDMVEAYRAAFAKLEVLLPPRFVATHDLPIKLIVYDESLWPRSTQEEVAAMLAGISDRVPKVDLTPRQEVYFDQMRAPWLTSQAVEVPDKPSPPQTPASVFFTDMRLTDLDEVVIFSLAPPGYNQTFSISLRSTLVAHLMGKRTSSLPPWFMRGFLEVYREVEFNAFGLSLSPLELDSTGATAAAQNNPETVTAHFVPLPQLLFSPPAHRDVLLDDRQLGLFVRWALDPKGGNAPDALWTLVEHACGQPVDEAAIQRAFLLSSAEIDQALRDYLPHALRHGVHWDQPAVELAEITFREATSIEVARIKGDWERLEADWVRHNHRELEDRYADKARQTLYRGGRKGDADPQLLVVRALFELEAGDPTAAEELLAKALATGAPLRPRAYLELARLRFARWQADNAGTDELLPAAVAAPWLELLRTAAGSSPQMPEVYHTYLAIIAARQGRFTAEDAEFIGKGGAAYPRDRRIALARVLNWIELGREDIALTLISRALAWGVVDPENPDWVKVRKQVSSPPE